VLHKKVQFGHGFKVVLGDAHAQAAQMTLSPGTTEAGLITGIGAPSSGCSLSPVPGKRWSKASASIYRREHFFSSSAENC
jgi:hypothetical protein